MRCLELRAHATLFVPDAYDDLAPSLAFLEGTEALCKPFKREDLRVDDRFDFLCRQ